MNFDDHVAIERLIHLYPDHADRGDIDAIGALFAHAEIHAPGFEQPFHADGDPEAFADVYRNIVIESEGPDRALQASHCSPSSAHLSRPLRQG